MPESKILLAIDTCGPMGTVALGRFSSHDVEILGQLELEGRSYSSTLVLAVGQLLEQTGMQLGMLDAMVAVNGPGSFTGVRVGLAAVKGLAEARHIPVVAISRLEVLASKSRVAAAALDAHRHEIYLRLGGACAQGRELLAGAQELAAIDPAPQQIAFCDEVAAQVLAAAWPASELIRTTPPTAADAIELCETRVRAGEFADLEVLDGHYLRRSDAEIFGEHAQNAPQHA